MTTEMVYAALAAYILIGSIVAWLSRHGMGQGMSEYFLANRSIGGLVAALTYSATTYSAFMMVGLAGLTYRGGVGAMGFELIYLSGLVLVVFFGPRFWLAGKKYGYVTPAEMLGDRYQSRAVAVIAALANLIFLVPYSSVQLAGVGLLLSGMTQGEITFTAGMILATILSIVWSMIAGMRSVAWTDSLQSVFMIITSTLVLFLVLAHLGGVDSLFAQLQQDYPQWLSVPGNGYFNFQTFLGLSLPWFFFSLTNPQVSQRLFIPRSMQSMRSMVNGFLIFGFIYTLVSILWGFSARILFPNLPNADLATPALLGSGIVNPWLSLLVMVGIMAAAVSTIDSILLTLSSMVARDIYHNMNPEAGEEQQLKIGKWVIPLIALIAYFFGSLQLDLIGVLSVASSAGLLIMVPVLVGTFFWKRGTASAAVASMTLGSLTAVFLQFSSLKPLGLWPGIWTLIVATAVFWIVSLVTPAPHDKAEKFLSDLNQELTAKGVSQPLASIVDPGKITMN